MDDPKLVEEFGFLLEQVFQGFSKLDFDGRFTWVNNGYARTLGYSPDELAGKYWWITVYPDDLRNILDAFYHMLETGRAEGEARTIRKDGSNFWTHIVLVKPSDHNGSPGGPYYWFMNDITERKDREQALKEWN